MSGRAATRGGWVASGYYTVATGGWWRPVVNQTEAGDWEADPPGGVRGFGFQTLTQCRFLRLSN